MYVLNNLGTVCVQAKEVEQAISYFKRSRDIVKVNFGQWHPHYAQILKALSGAYLKKGSGEALFLAKDALDIIEENYGKDAPETESFRAHLKECEERLF